MFGAVSAAQYRQPTSEGGLFTGALGFRFLLRCLHHRCSCYRFERSSSRAGFPPAVEQCLFTAHCKLRVKTPDFSNSLNEGCQRP